MIRLFLRFPPGTLFSDRNAAASSALVTDNPYHIRFDLALLPDHFSVPRADRHFFQAEVLIPTQIPASLVSFYTVSSSVSRHFVCKEVTGASGLRPEITASSDLRFEVTGPSGFAGGFTASSDPPSEVTAPSDLSLGVTASSESKEVTAPSDLALRLLPFRPQCCCGSEHAVCA